MGFRYEFDDTSPFFWVFLVVFILIFLVVIGIFVYIIVRNVGQWNKNNHSPRLTVNARIVGKRMDITNRHRTRMGGTMYTPSSTWYYVTFRFDSGDRMELPVNAFQYGMMAEGDYGQLTFQGTRCIDFKRQ
ncbi:MAG TPA: DUF2500 domain-containing protein [Candidatus Limousia pullorum]|uniref:DUF2500 domain-containing protein n=1 Tax=Candidatus Limousia pullorum TaxID=2840860 RepID=A0A9D1LXB6_9FIRM|nr:DUF2500 domain-containing protein [Candidatus Limousia pullorum]